MKSQNTSRRLYLRAEQKALQQFHHRVFRRALRLARQAGRQPA